MTALIDFSPLAKLGETFTNAYEAADRKRTLADIGKAAQDGNFDAAAKLAFANGDLTTGLLFAKTAQEREGQKEFDTRFGRGTGGGQAAGATTAAPAPVGGAATKVMPADPEIERRLLDTARAGGLTNPNALAVLGAFGQAESGYSPSRVLGAWSDPSQSGQPGTSGGALSWRNARLAAMRSAQGAETDPYKATEAQARFFLSENPQLTAALQNSKSVEEAHRLMSDAWKYAGYDQPGGESARRLAMAQNYLPKVADMPAQGARPAQFVVPPGNDPPVIVPGFEEDGPYTRASLAAKLLKPAPDEEYPTAEALVKAQAAAKAQAGAAGPATPATSAAGAPPAAPAQIQASAASSGLQLSPRAAELMYMMGLPGIGEGRKEAAKIALQQEFEASKQPEQLKLWAAAQRNPAFQEWMDRKDKTPRTLDPSEYAAHNIDPNYKGPVQIEGEDPKVPKSGKISFPGKPANEVIISGEKAYEGEQGKNYAKLANDINEQGRNANSSIGTIRIMKRLVDNPNFYSGTGGQTATTIKKAMVALKVADADTAAPNELFSKMSNQMVLDSAGGSLGTGFSNADRDFIVAKTANIGNTPEGNKSILDLAQKVEERKIEVAKFSRSWAKEHGGRLGPDFEDALQQWAEKNPAFPEAEKPAAAPATTGAPAAPVTLNGYTIKRLN